MSWKNSLDVKLKKKKKTVLKKGSREQEKRNEG